jgi:perosamine synthetase
MMFKSKKIPWWNLNLGKRPLKFFFYAYKNRFLSNGPVSLDFQKKLEKFLNVKHAALTTSGSTSLLIALKVLGIKEGDEIIVPARTFQATAHAAFFLGATLRCAEVDPVRGLITASTIIPLINEKTKAVIVVHLNGRAVDMDPVLNLAKEKNLYVIEDAAQAFGSVHKGKLLGSMGDIGCFSFGVTKFLTMGQGGAIVTNDNEHAKKIQNYLFQGQSGGDDKRFDSPGLNFRMSNLLVSIGVPQFLNFKKNKNTYVENFKLYKKLLSSVSQIKFIPVVMPGEVPIWIEVLAEKRNELYDYLKLKNIESVKFYPSIHEAEYLKQTHLNLPNADTFSRNGLILPSGLNLSHRSIRRITKSIIEFYGEQK